MFPPHFVSRSRRKSWLTLVFIYVLDFFSCFLFLLDWCSGAYLGARLVLEAFLHVWILLIHLPIGLWPHCLTLDHHRSNVHDTNRINLPVGLGPYLVTIDCLSSSLRAISLFDLVCSPTLLDSASRPFREDTFGGLSEFWTIAWSRFHYWHSWIVRVGPPERMVSTHNLSLWAIVSRNHVIGL